MRLVVLFTVSGAGNRISRVHSALDGIKKRVSNLPKYRKEMGLNKVSWWGDRGAQIKNQYDFYKKCLQITKKYWNYQKFKSKIEVYRSILKFKPI